MPKILVIALLVATTAQPASATEPAVAEYAPAGERAYTLDLERDGYTNGAMDPDRMMTYKGCTLERDAAYTWALMVEAAEDDGIRLAHVDCYRSYNQQKSAYVRGCPVTEIPVYKVDELSGQWVNTGVRRVRVCGNGPIAAPGASNHGWGRAVDVRARRGKLTCYDDEFHWLKLNAHRFGWVHPAWAHCGETGQEPWHWEWAGVTQPIQVAFTVLDPAYAALAE